MHRVFLLSLSVLITYSFPAHGQKSQPKNEKPWRELVIGAWRVDSLVEVRDGERHLERDRRSEKKPVLCFLPKYKVASLERNKASFFDYDLLEGANGRYLRLNESRGYDFQIVELTSNSLVLKNTRNADSKYERGSFIYLTTASFPIDSFRKKLAGNYKLAEKEDDHTARDSVGIEDVLNKSPFTISLGTDGKMGSYLGNTKDTGTWTLNPGDFNIVLKGKRSTQELEIKYWRGRDEIYVHPKGTPEDSAIRFEKIPENEPGIVTTTKSVPVVASIPESSSYTLTQLSKSWKAISVTTKKDETKVDSLKESVRFNLLEDGTFNLFIGKSRYNGQWRRIDNQNALILSIKGQEQLAIYKFKYDYSPDGVSSNVPDTQLVITLIPPKSKTALTYVFEIQK